MVRELQLEHQPGQSSSILLTSLCFAMGKSLVLCSFNHGPLHAWNIQSSRYPREISELNPYNPYAIATHWTSVSEASLCGLYLATAGRTNNSIILWDLKTLTPFAVAKVSAKERIKLLFTPDTRRLVVAEYDSSTIQYLNIASIPNSADTRNLNDMEYLTLNAQSMSVCVHSIHSLTKVS
jgi:WD40 repeat protein